MHIYIYTYVCIYIYIYVFCTIASREMSIDGETGSQRLVCTCFSTCGMHLSVPRHGFLGTTSSLVSGTTFRNGVARASFWVVPKNVVVLTVGRRLETKMQRDVQRRQRSVAAWQDTVPCTTPETSAADSRIQSSWRLGDIRRVGFQKPSVDGAHCSGCACCDTRQELGTRA